MWNRQRSGRLFETEQLVLGGLLALLLCLPAAGHAAGLQDDVDQAVAIIERIQSIPEQAVPNEVIAKARGLAILTVTKAGLMVSARAGKGVVVSRSERGWSPPSAVGTGGAGFGFQIGAQVSEFIFVLNTPAAVAAFAKGGNLTLGGELSVAAGPIGRNLGAAVAPQAAIYTYSRSQGAFAGVSLEGTVIGTRKKANAEYYGRPVEASAILAGKIPPPSGSMKLVRTLDRMSTVPAKPSSKP